MEGEVVCSVWSMRQVLLQMLVVPGYRATPRYAIDYLKIPRGKDTGSCVTLEKTMVRRTTSTCKMVADNAQRVDGMDVGMDTLTYIRPLHIKRRNSTSTAMRAATRGTMQAKRWSSQCDGGSARLGRGTAWESAGASGVASSS